MTNSYATALADLKARDTHLLKEVGDQWRTPDWVFGGASTLLAEVNGEVVIDLFTDGDNSKAPNYFTAEDNALRQSWAGWMADYEMNDHHGETTPWAWANPPYSRVKAGGGEVVTGMPHIMRKAARERDRGVRSLWLVKAATSEPWWPGSGDVKADHIMFITGRIGFTLPQWYRPAPGESKPSSSGFGAALLFFARDLPPALTERSYINRDELRARSLNLPWRVLDDGSL